MVDPLYDKQVFCPICKNMFHTKKVRSSKIRLEKRDTDFCVYYNGVNPIFYAVFVCPNCGYTALESMFDKISPKEREKIYHAIARRWVQRDLGQKRDIYQAINTYKLALLCGQIIQQKKSAMGILCLRLAWLYRYIGHDRERHFLEYAKNFLEEAFLNEHTPLGNLDDISMMYLIGELNFRLENYEESLRWLGRVIEHKGIKRKRKLNTLAREQWQSVKEIYKLKKESKA